MISFGNKDEQICFESRMHTSFHASSGQQGGAPLSLSMVFQFRSESVSLTVRLTDEIC